LSIIIEKSIIILTYWPNTFQIIKNQQIFEKASRFRIVILSKHVSNHKKNKNRNLEAFAKLSSNSTTIIVSSHCNHERQRPLPLVVRLTFNYTFFSKNWVSGRKRLLILLFFYLRSKSGGIQPKHSTRRSHFLFKYKFRGPICMFVNFRLLGTQNFERFLPQYSTLCQPLF
jgi:hypothetical protein